MEEQDFRLDCLERYADAVERFTELYAEARETETKLDAMIKAYPQYKLMEINGIVDKYGRISRALNDTDREIGALYDACIMALDASFKHTCELRLPRLMLSFINARKAQIRDLYFVDD